MSQSSVSIPDFLPNGNLPPGTFKTSIDEVKKKFGGPKSLKRTTLTEKLFEFYQFMRHHAIYVYVDGSFTTAKISPNDVDLLVIVSSNFSRNLSIKNKYIELLTKYKGSLHIFLKIEGVDTNQINDLLITFTHDRDGNNKGIILLES